MEAAERPAWFAGRLVAVQKKAGNPTQADLLSPRTVVPPKGMKGWNSSSLSTLLSGKFKRPPGWDVIEHYVRACAAFARSRRLSFDLRTTLEELWLDYTELVDQKKTASRVDHPLAEKVDVVATGSAFTLGDDADLVLTDDEADDLRDILDGAMAPESIQVLYCAATLHTSGLPPCPDDLWLAVETLRRLVGKRPLFEFLVRLASGPDTVTRERMWDWLREVGPRYSIDLKKLSALDQSLRPVIVQASLEREYLGPGFEVSVATYLDHDGRRVHTSIGPQSWGDVCVSVGAALAEIAALGITPTIVEFRLPLGLLGAEVENMRVELPGQQVTLGKWCPVVVRPLARAVGPTAVELWERKWRDLLERGNQYDERAVRIVDTSDPLDEAAWHDTLCLGVRLDRRSGPDGLSRVLTAAFQAGVPLVIWHRDNDFRGPADNALDRILRGRPLNQLPEVVHRQRKAACFPSARLDHPGRDVVLLWDDPGRLPPDMNWHAPRHEGER